TRDGLVVTPSSNPLEASDLISAVSAVSTKNFMPSLRFAATPGGSERVGHLGSYRTGSGYPMRGTAVVRRVPVLLPYPLVGPFDYRVPPGLNPQPGDVVLASLNGRQEMGVVWDAPADPDCAAATVPDHKLKPLLGVVDTPKMRPELRQFIDWMASYTLSPPGEVMAMALRVVRALPAAAIGWRRADPLPDTARLTEARRRVINVLSQAEPRGTAELARVADVGGGVIRGMADAGLLLPA